MRIMMIFMMRIMMRIRMRTMMRIMMRNMMRIFMRIIMKILIFFCFFLNTIVNDMMMIDLLGWPYDRFACLLFYPIMSFQRPFDHLYFLTLFWRLL